MHSFPDPQDSAKANKDGSREAANQIFRFWLVRIGRLRSLAKSSCGTMFKKRTRV